MKTLGIETSCDETAIAIYDSKEGIIGESIYSQIDMHAEYGGVVPELASRDHCVKIVDVLLDALGDLSIKKIDQIAYTSGPGLLGTLLIGESFAQGLSTALDIPLIPINHLEGHLMSPMMEFPEIKMPFICLLVSGGHTMIVDVIDKGKYEIIGQSEDDAVGEAFDKTAKMLRLGYPGGPAVEKFAKQGDKNFYKLPQPIINKAGCNLSFAGLKTAILRITKGIKTEQEKFDLAACFQKTIEEILYTKTKKAFEEYKKISKWKINNFVVAGGVAANKGIRNKLNQLSNENNFQVIYPHTKLCGDNAAMIAMAGLERFKDNQFDELKYTYFYFFS